MSGYFSKDFLDKIKDTCDITSVVSSYITLSKNGSRYKARCPFHDEKTPSFVVTPERGRYYCFGCQANGDSINFVMEYNKVTFSEAVELLASMYSIPIEYEKNSNYKNNKATNTTSYEDKKNLYEIMKASANQYYKQLLENTTAYNYLKNRGISKETIKHFGIGYAINEYNGMENFLAEKNFSQDLIISAGIVKVNENKNHYDYFRDRIMFPIQDITGRVVAFGGRIFNDNQKNAPKYLNTPETPIFTKNSILYNLNNAKKHISDENGIILVEGYMDIISLYDKGILNAVATLGTAFTQNHSRIIKNQSNNVIIMYDSDEAGLKATIKASDILENDGIFPKVVRLPIGEDPDSFILKNGLKAFNKLISKATPSIEFKINLLENKYDLLNNWDKVEYIKKSCLIIKNVNDEIRRDFYAKQLSLKTNTNIESILKEIYTGSHINTNHIQQKKPIVKEDNNLKIQSFVLKFLLECEGDVMDYIDKYNINEYLFTDENYKIIFSQILSNYPLKGTLDINDILGYNEEISIILSRIVSLDENISIDNLVEYINILNINLISNKMINIKEKIKTIENTDNEKVLNILLMEFHRLKKELLQRKSERES